jgi:hypothetical protein
MKTFFASCLAAAAALLFGACAATPTRSTTAAHRPIRLQMTVDVPPTMNLLVQEDVAEAFAYRVSAALHEQGLRGRIRYVERGDTLAPDVPVLAVMLREWRVDRLGSVDCVFTANLQTPAGSRNLGAFSGTAMMRWSRPGWYDRQQDFEEAAQDALSNLGRRIMQTGLLPDAQLHAAAR